MLAHAAECSERLVERRRVYPPRSLKLAVVRRSSKGRHFERRCELGEPSLDMDLTRRPARAPRCSRVAVARALARGQLDDWIGHSPEELRAVRDGLAALQRKGAAHIED